MMSGKEFVEMLRRIGYPGVDQATPSSLDWMFEDPDLKSLVQSLCLNLTAKNIVTDEELAEYEKLRTDPRVNEEELEHAALLWIEQDSRNMNTEEVIAELSEKNEQLRNKKRLLQRQMHNLKEHHVEMLQELELYEKIKRDQQMELRRLQVEVMPEMISQYAASLNSTCDLVEQLYRLYQADPSAFGDNQHPKSFFQIDLSRFVKLEEQLLETVSSFLMNDLNEHFMSKQGDGLSSDRNEYTELIESFKAPEKQRREVVRLRKLLPGIQSKEVETAFNVIKIKAEIQFYRELLASRDFSKFNLSPSELQSAINRLGHSLHSYEDEEQKLLAEAQSFAESEARARCDRVPILCCRERSQQFKEFIDYTNVPLAVLCKQRACLEFLSVVLRFEENRAKDVNLEMNTLREELDAEAEQMTERMEKYEKLMKQAPETDDSVINMICGLLGSPTPLGDPVDEACQLVKERRMSIGRLKEEMRLLNQSNLHWINNAESVLAELDSGTVSQRMQAFSPGLGLKEMNRDLADLSAKIDQVQIKFLDVMDDYGKKRKLIAKDQNLAISRNFYKYALTDPEKCRKVLAYIQQHVDLIEERSDF